MHFSICLSFLINQKAEEDAKVNDVCVHMCDFSCLAESRSIISIDVKHSDTKGNCQQRFISILSSALEQTLASTKLKTDDKGTDIFAGLIIVTDHTTPSVGIVLHCRCSDLRVGDPAVLHGPCVTLQVH